MPALRSALAAQGRWLLVVVLAASVLGASPASAAVPNPGWPGSCPQRFILLLDQSESMEPQEDEVQQAAEDLVDSLRGTTNNLAVVTFGTEAHLVVEMTDVSDDDRRDAVKDSVDGLDILRDSEGGTNWEAALVAAESLSPDVVVLVTDGQPSVRGVPVDYTSQIGDPLNVAAAVAASDRLKQAGTRVVGVGLGLDQATGGEANLVAVTGPALGDDYYTTAVHDLLPALYDVVSKTCAIAVPDLPAPEREGLALLPLVVGGALALGVVVTAGALLARRRDGGAPRSQPAAPRRTVIADPSITMDDVPPPQPSSRLARADADAGDEDTDERARDGGREVPEQPRRPARRITLPPPPPPRGPQAGPARD